MSDSFDVPPGFYRDGRGTVRWWDGSGWTEHVRADHTPSSGERPPRAPYRRRRWWATAAAVVLVVVAMAAGGGTEEDTEPTASPSSPSEEPRPELAPALPASPEPEQEAEREPSPGPRPGPERVPRRFVVTRVVDGDTVELGNGQQVRVVGIDTPEQGECGYEAASNHLAELVLLERVVLTVADEDTDRYGRLLRYVDVGDIDAGLDQIRAGFAIARYDSRDGYGAHPREARYVRADRRAPPFRCERPAFVSQPTQQGGGCHPGYTPCLPVVPDLDCGDLDGPVTVLGDDPYRLDADGDGTGCDG